MAAADSHTAAVKTDGSLWTWGENSRSQLGDGTTVRRPTPVRVGTASNWQSVFIDREYSIGLTAEKSIQSWGRSEEGQLGRSFILRLAAGGDWGTPN